ncbi:MAG: pirin family protein [Pseudomonadota bacterium]|nr:pirin family protein [Pseudomonadota bacterium]
MSSTPQRLIARESIVGTDTTIRRALPHKLRRMVGAWCFLDHAGPVQFRDGHGLHVGAHPHIGLQTFTWMIEGEVMHRDSLGYEQVVKPGQVNLMTAGRGIAHSEDSVRDGERLHAAQLWIALPDTERHRPPAFRNYPDLPISDQGGFRATVLAGAAFGQSSPVEVFSPMLGIDFASETAASTVFACNPAWEYAAMVLQGAASVGGEPLPQGELLYFAPGQETIAIQSDDEARVLLLGGEPFGEDIVLWWNFVARTQAEIEQALAEWNQGERFGTVREGSIAKPLSAPALVGVNLKSRS